MRVAIYAGTFDPITRGHLSVIERGARLFDRLIVVVAVNPGKQPLFTVEERLCMIREVVAAWPNVGCASTGGYVVELAREVGAGHLVRGVRSCTDVEGELALANLNRELAPEIETVFIPAHPELSGVSSSKLKELARLGADLSPFCPEEIAARLSRRVGLSWTFAVTVGPFRIQSRRTLHHVPTSALLNEAAGRKLGYSSDTAFDPGLIEFLAPADLIIHETNAGPAHTPYSALAALPPSLQSRMRLIHYPDKFDAASSILGVLLEGEVLRP